MSDPSDTSSPRTGRGATPSRPERSDDRPLETGVTGSVAVAREVSKYEVGGINIDQLALALAERLKPKEAARPRFGELAAAWLEHIRPKRVVPENEERLVRRLEPLFGEDETTLTAASVAALLDAQADLSASTKNKLRGVGRMVVDRAAAAQRWLRPNPFALVKRQKEPRRKYEMLTLSELYKVQAHLTPERLRLFRCALHLGMRPGELMALRIEDIDFPANVIHVRRSWERNTTKTNTERDIPLHPAVMADLLDACVAAKGEHVFGAADDGQLERRTTKLTRILRTAMAAADVGVLGGDYKCRRKGCGHTETHLGPIDLRRHKYCPTCDFKLWVVPIVKEVRWYDLRHMCATFHHEAGADRVCISMALGHSLEGTTEEVYTHPTMAKMAAELSKWKLSRPPKHCSDVDVG